MSYILDALKKSEQERGRGSAPGVQTLHSSGLNYHSKKTQLWPYILLAAVFINLAALLYFITNRPDAGTAAHQKTVAIETAPETAPPMQTPTIKTTGTSASDGTRSEAIVYKPVSMPGTGNSRVESAPQASLAVAARPATTDQSILEMDELPFDVLQHIPALEFSAHIYSSNPVQRSIVINGRFMEEGDRVASDLFLSEITPDGAIFDFQGQLFHQRVVSTWN